MVHFKKSPGHHAIFFEGRIWLRTTDGFRAIGKHEARMMQVFYRSEGIKHERSEPVFSGYCAAVFQDLHDALTELRNASRLGDERRAVA